MHKGLRISGISLSSVNRQACLLDYTKLPAVATQKTFHLSFRSSKDQCYPQKCGRRVVPPLQVLTGFLIYDWIEKPHKQEVIKEVLSLLEQKILEPNSGEAHLTPPLFSRRAFTYFFPQGFHHIFHSLFPPSHNIFSDHTIVPQVCALLCEPSRLESLLHGFRGMLVVYLELLVVTLRTSKLPVCLYDHAASSSSWFRS